MLMICYPNIYSRVPYEESFFNPDASFECNNEGQVPESCVCNQDEEQIQCGTPGDTYLKEKKVTLNTVTPVQPTGVNACPNDEGNKKKRSVVSILLGKKE